MSTHAHTWTVLNAALRRYRCECGAIGHARFGRPGIAPYTCQHELDRGAGNRTRCGKDAVHVTAIRSQSRCAEHAPESATSERALEQPPART